MSVLDEVVEMWAAGITDLEEIAEEVGRSKSSVYRLLQNAGIKLGKPGRKKIVDILPEEKLDEILEHGWGRLEIVVTGNGACMSIHQTLSDQTSLK